MDILNKYDEGREPRPTFLTVLCILTFIGSGWGIIGGGVQYFTAEKQVQEISRAREEAKKEFKDHESSPGAKMAERMIKMSAAVTPAMLKKGALVNIFAAIACIMGAVLMWKQKRNGFFLYLGGILSGVIAPFMLFGMNNILAVGSSVLQGFVGVAFLIMYAVNLKHMH